MKFLLKLSILIFRNSPLFSTYGFRNFRWYLYRKYYNAPKLYVGERVVISIAHSNKNAFFKCMGELNIGMDVYIDYSGGVEIKEKVAISEGAKIFTHNHSIHDGKKNWKENPIVFSPLLIEDYVWIGADAIILPSVSLIAEGSIVAAGAILSKNTEAYGIYGGNPAVKIGVRRINEK